MTENTVVLLAAYNGAKWIESQIQSILNQTDVPLDIYISLDLSTDNSLELCQKLTRQYDNIYLLPYGECYGSAGANFYRLLMDVEVSQYKYVSLSDQDDLWDPTKLKRAIGVLSTSGFAAYSSDVIAIWESGRRHYIRKSFPQREFDHYFEAAGPGCSYVLSSVVVKEFADFLRKYPEVTKKIDLHDWFVYCFTRCRGYSWYIDRWPSLEYRQHDENVVGANVGLASITKRLRLLRSRWYRDQVSELMRLFPPERPIVKSRFGRILSFRQLRRSRVDALKFLLISIFGWV